jgi:hypothetical protein
VSAEVQDALKYAAPNPPARVLDPWNGSGTTTEIATALGFEALGFDLNPAMVVVAKARLLDSTVRGSLTSILDDLLTKTTRSNHPESDEPLANWFTAGSAAAFRRFERAIQTLLINQHDHRILFDLPTLNHVSSLAAFFYVAAENNTRSFIIWSIPHNPFSPMRDNFDYAQYGVACPRSRPGFLFAQKKPFDADALLKDPADRRPAAFPRWQNRRLRRRRTRS